MSKNRFFVFGVLGVAMLSAIILAIPDVHWPLIGWWRGEPCWQRRPVSWWRAQIDASHVSTLIDSYSQAPATEKRVLCRLEGAFEWPNGSFDLSGEKVLLLLLEDPDPKVRYYAAERLGSLEQTSSAILAALRKHTNDSETVIDDVTAGSAASRALKKLADRPSARSYGW